MNNGTTALLALLCTLELLPFGLALARFPQCTKYYKRALVGTSTQPYFVSYTHQQVRCYISSYAPKFARLLVSDIGNSRVKKPIQATFVMKSGVTDLVLGTRLLLPCLFPLVLQ
jgi:hypothetical protein